METLRLVLEAPQVENLIRLIQGHIALDAFLAEMPGDTETDTPQEAAEWEALLEALLEVLQEALGEQGGH
jgi:hypothetical protein